MLKEVPVKWSSVEDIITVTVEGTSVDGIVAVDALFCMDVVVEAIILVEVVDCFDVIDDVAVNVVSAGDNVEVVVVIVMRCRRNIKITITVMGKNDIYNYTINDTIGYHIGLSRMYINMMTKNYIWIRWSTHLLQGGGSSFLNFKDDCKPNFIHMREIFARWGLRESHCRENFSPRTSICHAGVIKKSRCA